MVEEINDGENGSMDLEPPDNYVKEIAVQKAKVANHLALILILSLVLSMPCYLLALWAGVPETAVEKVFDRWFNAISPLVAAIIGALFGMSVAKKH